MVLDHKDQVGLKGNSANKEDLANQVDLGRKVNVEHK